MKSLHKKADIIAALKCERNNNPCTGEKCKNCALRRDFSCTSSCYAVILLGHGRKALKKALITEIEHVTYPAPFATVAKAKALVNQCYLKSLNTTLLN